MVKHLKYTNKRPSERVEVRGGGQRLHIHLDEMYLYYSGTRFNVKTIANRPLLLNIIITLGKQCVTVY